MPRSATRIHRTKQHRSAVPGVEARTLVSDRSFPRHAHDQLGIGIMLSGAHRSWSAVGQVEACAGDAIMVNPGELHDGMPVGGAPRAWRMLYFDPAFVACLATPEGAEGSEIIRPAVHDPLLAARFRQVFDALTTSPPDPILVEESLVLLVMHVLRRHAASRRTADEPSPPVKRALARLEAEPAAAVSLTELARLAGVSRFQLVRGFAREVGATPHAYLIQRRVRLAARLLARGRSIAEAAIDAGFADQSHLTRAFVRQLGVTPGRYAAAIR